MSARVLLAGVATLEGGVCLVAVSTKRVTPKGVLVEVVERKFELVGLDPSLLGERLLISAVQLDANRPIFTVERAAILMQENLI
jgi:hypothetical protein